MEVFESRGSPEPWRAKLVKQSRVCISALVTIRLLTAGAHHLQNCFFDVKLCRIKQRRFVLSTWQVDVVTAYHDALAALQ